MIRAALADDWPQIERLLATGALPTDDLGPQSTLCFLVACEADVMHGVIAVEPLGQSAMLRSLVVHPDARSRGLGRALVASAEERARLASITNVFLLTTTADVFFARLGYRRLTREQAPRVVQTHPQFGTLCPATAVLMMKTLRTNA